MRAVQRVRGVRDIVNELDVHARPDGIPALQGGRRVTSPGVVRRALDRLLRMDFDGPRRLVRHAVTRIGTY